MKREGSAGAHTKILERNAVFLTVDTSCLESLQCLPTTTELSWAKPDYQDLKRRLGNQEIIPALNSDS